MVNGRTRLAARFNDDSGRSSPERTRATPPPRWQGLVTFAPDELDWEDEIRLAIEERASLSPDALTGLEANLRFAGAETGDEQDLRPALGLAELDLLPAQRRRRARRAKALRQRRQAALRSGEGLVFG